jgi:hypothetical protein
LQLPASLGAELQEVLAALLGPLLKQILCQLLPVTSCEEVVEVVVVSVASSAGGEDPDRRRRRSTTDDAGTVLSTVSFYATQGGSVIDANAVIAASDAAATTNEGITVITADGAELVVVGATTQAAREGPTFEFDCQSLPSTDCAGMQSACTGWCRGPVAMQCDQHPEFYPVNTVVHSCNCARAEVYGAWFWSNARLLEDAMGSHTCLQSIQQRVTTFMVSARGCFGISHLLL